MSKFLNKSNYAEVAEHLGTNEANVMFADMMISSANTSVEASRALVSTGAKDEVMDFGGILKPMLNSISLLDPRTYREENTCPYRFDYKDYSAIYSILTEFQYIFVVVYSLALNESMYTKYAQKYEYHASRQSKYYDRGNTYVNGMMALKSLVMKTDSFLSIVLDCAHVFAENNKTGDYEAAFDAMLEELRKTYELLSISDTYPFENVIELAYAYYNDLGHLGSKLPNFFDFIFVDLLVDLSGCSREASVISKYTVVTNQSAILSYEQLLDKKLRSLSGILDDFVANINFELSNIKYGMFDKYSSLSNYNDN